jgi:gliding motility-associated-like protein
MKHSILATILTLVFPLIWGKTYGQDESFLSNRGTDFWVGYGHTQAMESGNTQEMVLYLSTDNQPAVVTVRIEGTAWVRTYTIPANTVRVSDLIPKAGTSDARLYTVPCGFSLPGQACGGEGTFNNKGIHITSNVPIVAYAHIYTSANSAACMLMPVETWGYDYVTLNSKQSYAPNCFSTVYVIAKEDNTVIEVTPAANNRAFGVGGAPNPRAAGVPYTIILNRGQIYQCMAGPENADPKPEMSGTRIKSLGNSDGVCHPIAVFAGSSRTSNPASCGQGGGDNDNQQCFPIQAWGKKYLTAPLSSSNVPANPMTNTYKIAVYDPTTVVKRNGVPLPLASLLNNSYYTFVSTTADFIEADKPVMLAQFMTGGACLGGGNEGDPEMIYLSPLEQGIKKITFFRNNQTAINTNYLTLIIPTAGVSSLRIDNSSVFSHTYPHPNLPGYTVVIRRWSSAQAQSTAFSDSAFTAVTYGLGGVESYGYNAGTKINALNAKPSIHNAIDTSVEEHDFTCTKTPVEISILLGYDSLTTEMKWLMSQVGGGVSPNRDTTIFNPIPTDTVYINGFRYLKFTLPGTYTFTDSGTIRIPILIRNPQFENACRRGLVNTFVRVVARPVVDINVTHSGCVLDSVVMQSVISGGNFTINSYTWIFPPGATNVDTVRTQNTTHLFNASGIYPINISVISSEGCIGDSIRNIAISARPVVNFTTNGPVCDGASITFTDNSSYTGTAPLSSNWWDLGDGTITTANGPITHTYATSGTYNVRHTAGIGTNCSGDTISTPVTIYAIPNNRFTYPAGCLPASGIVQFNSTATAIDGQAIATHSWNFGDPGSGPANTSILPNPTHAYPTYGSYTIQYSVTTINGCSNDTTVNATFNLAPLFNYPALPSVCQNQTGTVSVATATVTNSVPGSGVYQGIATDAAGNFTPSLAGAGTHTIWYVYTTTANCRDSVSQTITVHPTPDPSFGIVSSACLPPSGTVSFTYNGTSVTGQTFTWNFGDPTSGAANTSTLSNPTHNYATGTYTINLSITANGCTEDSSFTNTFYVTPTLAYAPLTPVCESEVGTVSVASATVTNGAAGTGIYSGVAVDPNGNFSPSIAGAGIHTITYTFTGTGNCVTTITQDITVYAKPNASFLFTNSACLPTTGLAQFTYNGTASGITAYSWNFGDPASGANNTATNANPTHIYTNTGNYNVSLNVTNNNGCVDDTVVNRVFSVTPELNYPALSPVCVSDAGPINVATAVVINGVTGTGVYSGPGVDANGNFTPATAGPGTHVITYTYTSTGNCVGTKTQTILVYPKPSSRFTITDNICLGQQAVVNENSTISSGSIANWSWNFGDGGTANNTNGNTFNYTYSNYGPFTVTLVTTSALGCVSDPFTDNILVSAIPVASFNMPTSVCMPNGTVVFTNTSSVGDGSGLTYQWNFGDATPNSNATNASHVYGSINPYSVTLTVTSSFGCTDDTIRVFNAFFDKPVARFDVTPDRLCQGTDNRFTDQSFAPNSTVNERTWNFGDGTTSTQSNPIKQYQEPGRYEVSLVVKSTENCFSDPYTDSVIVYVQPVVDAGVSFVVAEGTTIRFRPVVNDSSNTISFLWSPGASLSSPNVLRPYLVATTDQTYTLSATGEGNCTDEDTMSVRILKPVVCPNAFSPNGDGQNDTWQLDNLADYPGAKVEVFNRYGQLVYSSRGYRTPWDGTSKGKPLPVATYYYVIQLQNGFKPLNGSVTIIR